MKIFERKTQGDPTLLIKDVVSKMTFAEVVQVSRELGIDPHVLSEWSLGTSKQTQNLSPPTLLPQNLTTTTSPKPKPQPKPQSKFPPPIPSSPLHQRKPQQSKGTLQ